MDAASVRQRDIQQDKVWLALGNLGEGGTGMTGGRGRGGRVSARPPEQLDPDTQEEIRVWEQGTPDKKLEMAKSLHTLSYGDFVGIRKIAVEEEAKKTTATIDGLLLARQERHDAYVKQAEEERAKLAPNQDTGLPAQYGEQGGRTRRGRTRGGMTGTQQQQQTQTGRRGRR